MESFNIVQQIREIATDFKNQILQQSNGVKIVIELVSKGDNDKDIFVKADRIQVIQLLNNLLENAAKFMNKEKARIIISIEKIRMVNEVEISITDNGKGVSSKMLPKLFSKIRNRYWLGTFYL